MKINIILKIMLCFLTLSSNAQEKINTTKNESELTNNCFLFSREFDFGFL